MLQHPTVALLRPGSHENLPRDSRTNITEISDLFRPMRAAPTPNGGQMSNRLLAAAANVVHCPWIIDQLRTEDLVTAKFSSGGQS
jgi:hypothetical protein